MPAIELAHERGLRIRGMEGFVVGESVYPSMSRIADFAGDAYDDAKALLTGPWAEVPDDLQEEAAGSYRLDMVVGD